MWSWFVGKSLENKEKKRIVLRIYKTAL